MILVHAELLLICIMQGLSPSIQFESFFFFADDSLLRGSFFVSLMLTLWVISAYICTLFQLLLLNSAVTDGQGNVI